MSSTIWYATVEAPIGTLTVATDGDSIVGLQFPTHGRMAVPLKRDWTRGDCSVLSEAAAQLDAYFAGHRTSFDLPLRPVGTAFQQAVWAQLCLIPFGETISYGELARRVGNPNASRAVGMANGRNPIAILIPCHRVIGADGSLTGFGGGVGVKRSLLELEGLPTLATA